jgi:hypothetical protein
MKPHETRCPGVLEKIAEVQALNDAGDCWCTCVNDDLPKARDLAMRGLCLGAMKVIKAARARCTSKAEKFSTGTMPGPATLEPLRALTAAEMMAGPPAMESDE